MGTLTDLLKKHVSGAERRSVTVRLTDQDVTLYAAPMTGEDLDRLMRRHPNFATTPTIGAAVDLIIAKTEIESGEKAFDVGDKVFLLRLDVGVINTIRVGLWPDADADLSDQAIEEDLGN